MKSWLLSLFHPSQATPSSKLQCWLAIPASIAGVTRKWEIRPGPQDCLLQMDMEKLLTRIRKKTGSSNLDSVIL
jgi:hypothetical protein